MSLLGISLDTCLNNEQACGQFWWCSKPRKLSEQEKTTPNRFFIFLAQFSTVSVGFNWLHTAPEWIETFAEVTASKEHVIGMLENKKPILTADRVHAGENWK
jgi:hypothetical protein